MSSSIIRQLSPVPLSRVTIQDSFWAPRQEINRRITIPAIYRRLKETGHIEQLKLEWKPGMPNPPHIFRESELAKWIEAVSYSLVTHPGEKLEALLDEIIGLLAKAQQPDGYLNAYFTVVEPGKRWMNLRDAHELYCAGHLVEAAVAHYNATGKRSLLDVMCRYADYIDSVFGPGPGQKRGYCGHPEIELALIKLYCTTGEPRYLRLSQFFVEERGKQPHYFDQEARARGENPADFWAKSYAYSQSHLPVRAQTEAVGHAVRAMYLYCATTDLALETGDETLLQTCERLYESVCHRRMYVTGGIGSDHNIEGFTSDYDLPNESAYAETCAAIGLFLWMHRMLHIACDGRYTDVMERCLFNGILSGISLTGDRFFYENPLAVSRQREIFWRDPLHRQEWYAVACCPPNIARVIASLGAYIYAESDTDAIVHLYVQGSGTLHVAGQKVIVRQATQYPWDGVVKITVETERSANFGLKLRIPGWCRHATLTVNGQAWAVAPDRGYVRIQRFWNAGDEAVLTMAIPIERVYAHPQVAANRGCVALQRGPVIYCLEGVDNGDNLHLVALPRTATLEAQFEKDLLGGGVTIHGEVLRAVDSQTEMQILYSTVPPTYQPFYFKAVPYYAWDNRDTGDMLVWIHELEA